MIIIDMNQICLASVMMSQQMSNSSEVDDKMIRHMILNSIRLYRGMFNEKYGEVVLTYDSKHYWRRDYFEQYKHNRKKGREKDSKDWNAIFECLNQIKSEFKENLPYKFVEVYGAEADDIIATLVKNFQDEEIMIISGDKDFIQLQTHTNVKQYSPILKKYVNGEDPETYIKQHILKGDASDGVPNVLSPDNTFTDGLRQKPLGKKKISSWADHEFSDVAPNDEVLRNYQRNKKLIDLTECPEELREEILENFRSAEIPDRSKLLNYFIEKRLKTLTDSIGEF